MFKDVSSLLSKFINLTPPERFIKEIFINITTSITGITLKKEEIEIRGSILYITTNSITKNELFLKKDTFLQKLNEELERYKKVIKDIR